MRLLQDNIVRLLKDRPFYGQFLLQFRRQQLTNSDKAVAVTIADATPTISVNLEHFARFSPLEQQALLEHLIKHVLHLHPCRRRERQLRHWDLACDLAINPGIPNLPPEAAQPERLHLPPGLAAEEYYTRLIKIPQLGNQSSTGNGESEQDPKDHRQAALSGHKRAPQPLETADEHRLWQEADRTPTALAEQVVRQMVRTAWQRVHGEVPDELRELLNSFLATPEIPWQQILRQFVGNAGRIGRTNTWKRSHRRFGHSTPGIRKRQLLNLVVGIDVSDSTDTQQMREAFARELLQIAHSRHSRITVLYAGSRIQKICHFSNTPQVTEVFHGGGFTDLRPVFDYAQRMQPRPAALIYLTDGFGPAPEQSTIPTLWVLSPDGEKPVDWGLELRLKNIKEQL